MKRQRIGCGHKNMCSWRCKGQRTVQQVDGVLDLVQDLRDQHRVERAKLSCSLTHCRILAIAFDHEQSWLSRCAGSRLLREHWCRLNNHPSLEIQAGLNCR